MLRISDKYNIHNLYDTALGYLQADWPATLAGWDLRERMRELQRQQDDAGMGGHGNESGLGDGVGEPDATSPQIEQNRNQHPHPIRVVKLARQLGLSGVLLCAFYELARLRPSEILRGAEPDLRTFSEDAGMLVDCGEIMHVDSEGRGEVGLTVNRGGESDEDSGMNSSHRGQQRECLDRADLLLVLRGKERLAEFSADFIRIVIDERMIAEQCDKVDPERCRRAFRGLFEFLLRKVAGAATTRPPANGGQEDFGTLGAAAPTAGEVSLTSDPLTVLQLALEELAKEKEEADNDLQLWPPLTHGACDGCKEEFQTEVIQARERCWEYMHHWFGLQHLMMDDVESVDVESELDEHEGDE